MSVKSWATVVAIAVLLVVVVGAVMAWEDVRRQQAELQVKLTAAQGELQAANAREQSRNTELEKELAEIAQEKKSVQTSAQVLQALPGVLPLPKPLAAEPTVPVAGQVSSANTKGAPKPTEPPVQLPSEDLKPLYDYALGCKACQEQLTAAQADLKDEKTKTQALGRERDDALHAARGGSLAQRVVRAAKWFVLGAAAGAVAAKLAR
jgi:hypothetical protein